MDHYHCCLDFNFTFPRNLVLLRPAEQWRIYEVSPRGTLSRVLWQDFAKEPPGSIDLREVDAPKFDIWGP